jgi:hydroxypyruvate isomerase
MFPKTNSLSRRAWLQTTSASTAMAAAGIAHAQLSRSSATKDFRVKNNRIRQSVMGWCFLPNTKAETLAKHAQEIGLVGIEGIPREAYPAARALGLEISLGSSHSFKEGPCDPKFIDKTIAELTRAIEVAAANDCSRVITFTGMRFDGMNEAQAVADCIATWKKVLPLAEKHKVTLCLEHLNSRDGTHPMKGHPGYFGDDVDFCVDLIREVDSEYFKLLFDIYHVSIMNGDIIRRIRQYKDVIAHYHTAGNPGRGELDDTQEINFPAVMHAILDTGYTGYVAQEFIPTWDDPVAALRHAAEVCDI